MSQFSPLRAGSGLPDADLTNLETFYGLNRSVFKLELSDVSFLRLEDDSVERVKRK